MSGEQLAMGVDPLTQRTNESVLSDVAEAAGFLAMGDSTDGLRESSLIDLRRRVLDGAADLARRWGMQP